jgi:molecular chaperone DnaJ
MADKSYYEILGVEKDASEKDIKQKYRDLSKKYHPDRQVGKSDSEKQEAENKFKEISEAYAVLSDPEKRKHYDMHGSMDGSNFDFGDIFSGFGDLFSGFGDIFGHKYNQNKQRFQNGESYNINIGINIKDIYTGINKTFDIEVNKRCPDCNGAGGKNVEKCPKCNGTGTCKEVKYTAFGRMENVSVCRHCNGTGEIIKDKCNKCSGSGFVIGKETIDLRVPSGVKNGQQFHFKGKGSDSKYRTGGRGDVTVTIVYQFDTDRYRIINNDIYEQIQVPYYDLIGGNDNAVLTLPDGTTVNYKIPRGSQSGQQIVIRGKGLNGGNYILIPVVKLPTNPGKSEIENLKNLINKLENE